MRARHYYVFEPEVTKKFSGSKLNETNWNILRTDEVESPFAIENSIEQYEMNCKNSEAYRQVAKLIISVLEEYNLKDKRIVSCGAGKGILEWHIKNECPEMRVEITDYAEESIDALKRVFIRMDDAYTFDMLEGDYEKLGVDATIVMYRVSTEFSRRQWCHIFEKMYKAGVTNIIFVPTELASVRLMVEESIRHVINKVKGRKDMLCGWLYSENEFLRIFRGRRNYYSVSNRTQFGNTAVYYLKRNCD